MPYWCVKALFLFSRTPVAIGIFCLAVLSLTRLDFLVNNILYRFGLTFSGAWHQEYSILYFLAYQLLIFTRLAYTRNLTAEYKLFGFWNTASQLLLSLCSVSSILILLRFARVSVRMRALSIACFFSSKNAKTLQKSLRRSE
jgi:hypothetical protein